MLIYITNMLIFDNFCFVLNSLVVILASLGQKIHANAEADSEELVNPPKVEEKIGAVPNGLSTDSDVAKRFLLF